MKISSEDKDMFNDVNRWVSNAIEEISVVTEKRRRYFLNFQNLSEFQQKSVSMDITESQSFLVMVRKGIDWFYNRYGYYPPKVENFLDTCKKDYERLSKIKVYLSRRIRKHSNFYNIEKSKNLKIFVESKLKALYPFISKKYQYKNINLYEN